jgi:hypothetical protein
VLLQILDLVVARHRQLARGRDDLQRRVERLDADVEAHLVVALAGAAMRHRRRPFFVRDVHEQLRHQRPREGGRERIGVLVDGPRGERREGEVADEVFLGVDDADLRGPGGKPAGLHHRLLAALAEVDIQRDYLVAAFDGEPLDGGRCIETAGKSEDKLGHGHNPGR